MARGGRFAAAHLIFSRRQSGMSEEQLQACYHASRKHRAARRIVKKVLPIWLMKDFSEGELLCSSS
jgi:hypothetical protein